MPQAPLRPHSTPAASPPSHGARIRAARSAAGLTLRELAEAISVSPATLSQIENDNTGVTLDRLDDIAAALDMHPAEILTGSRTTTVRRTDPTGAAITAAPPAATSWRSYRPLVLPPILAASLDEFLEVGYHGTSMRRIAARCRVSAPGIYARFPSKQAILTTILADTMSDLEWRARAASAEGHGPVARFRLLVENLALYHTYRHELGFIGASEVRALEPANRRAIAARRDAQQHLVTHEVLAACEVGAFHVDDPENAARVVVTMCTALPTWWRADGPLGPPDIARQLVDLALRIVGYRGPVNAPIRS